MNTKTTRQHGFTILEGLIAVVIFAMGMIALATFQGGIMSESGEVKARNEAVVLAQDKADELRAMMVRGDFDNRVAGGTDVVNGNNAAFTRNWTVSDSTTPEYKLVEVAVAWTDPDGEAQLANMDTLIAWNDPRAGITQTGLLNTGRTISEPSGGERNPGVVYDDMPTGAIDLGDGFSIYARNDDKTHLIRNDETIDTDGDGTNDAHETVLEVYSEGIVMLRGVIELRDNAVTTAEDLTAEVLALTSDAGFCVYPEQPVLLLEPEQAAANDTESTNYFHCYVGENWYGNLGIAGADSLDSVCPLIFDFDPVILTSQAPNLVSATRINSNTVGNGILSVLPNQNFLIVRLLGNDTCDSFSTQSPTATITGNLMVNPAETGLGDTRIEATPDIGCPIVADVAAGHYTFRCDVDTGLVNGWNGTVRLIPDPGLGVCGSNEWSTMNTLFVGDTVQDVNFELIPLGSGLCTGTYEYTITVEVEQIGSGQGIADQLLLSTNPSPGPGNCVLSSLAGGKKNAVYRCAVIAEPGALVGLTGDLALDGRSVIPDFQLVELPGVPADGVSWVFNKSVALTID